MESWPVSWQECYAAFLQSIYDLSGSERSRETYCSNLVRFFQHCKKLPDQVSRSDVISFMQLPSTGKRTPGAAVSASTKNQRLCVLVSFFKFASGYEIDEKPLYAKVLPTQGMRYLKRSIAYRAMNAEELDLFFAVIPDTLKGVRDRALFLLYFLLGRRRSELYNLRWKDIEATVIVDQHGVRRAGHVYRYYGKGYQRQVHTKELPEYGYKILCNYLAKTERLSTIRPDDYIFISIHPGQGRHDGAKNVPMNHNTINSIFRQYCAQAGLDVNRLSLHSLRHTSAHERYTAGEDIRSIQNLLDHSSLATTDTYLRVLAGTADNGAMLLEAKFAHLNQTLTTSQPDTIR